MSQGAGARRMLHLFSNDEDLAESFSNNDCCRRRMLVESVRAHINFRLRWNSLCQRPYTTYVHVPCSGVVRMCILVVCRCFRPKHRQEFHGTFAPTHYDICLFRGRLLWDLTIYGLKQLCRETVIFTGVWFCCRCR